MSTSNGQIANAQTFNDAFVSKQSIGQDVDGTINLQNGSSGSPVNNVQQEINDIKTVNANQDSDITNLQNTKMNESGTVAAETIPVYVDGQNLTPTLVTIDIDGNIETPGAIEALTLQINDNAVIDGDLTVNGLTTFNDPVFINTTNLEVADQNIVINKNGTDLTSEGAGLTVERVGVDGSLIYGDAFQNKFAIGPLGSELPIATMDDIAAASVTGIQATVGVADADEFIKTASDGFLDKSFNNTIPSYADDAAFTTALGRSAIAGDRYYDTTLRGLKVYDAALSIFVLSSGSGGEGERNFITNGSAEINTTGWATYADAANARPVDGTGSSANVTLTRSTTSPLDGTASFIFTKDAVNRQGEGASFDFEISNAFKAKVLTIEADYLVNSGAFAAGSSSADSDLIFYIYDVDAAQLIEPSSFKLLSNSTTISDRFSATFQTSAASNNYRLIMHVATTSASAWSLKLDNIKVSPSRYVFGSPITDWQSFTPTGAWTTNTTYTGRFRRVGDSAEIQYSLLLSGAPNAASLLINYPSGLVPDETKLSATANLSIGNGTILDAGTRQIALTAIYNGTANFGPQVQETTGSNGLTQTTPITFAINDRVHIQVKVPIVGWSSSVQMSDSGADTRVLATRVNSSGTQSIPNGTWTKITNLATAVIDKNAIWDNSNKRITISNAGLYLIITNGTYINNGTGARAVSVTYNGAGIPSEVGQGGLGTANDTVGITGVFLKEFNAGEFIEGSTYQNSGGALNLIDSSLTVFRLSGPSAIAASEKIIFKSTNSTTSVISSGSLSNMNITSASINTHGILSANALTVPAGGEYEFEVLAYIDNASTGALVVSCSVNNIDNDELIRIPYNSTSGVSLKSGTILKLNAGDVVRLRALQNTGSTRNISFIVGLKRI